MKKIHFLFLVKNNWTPSKKKEKKSLKQFRRFYQACLNNYFLYCCQVIQTRKVANAHPAFFSKQFSSAILVVMPIVRDSTVSTHTESHRSTNYLFFCNSFWINRFTKVLKLWKVIRGSIHQVANWVNSSYFDFLFSMGIHPFGAQSSLLLKTFEFAYTNIQTTVWVFSLDKKPLVVSHDQAVGSWFYFHTNFINYNSFSLVSQSAISFLQHCRCSITIAQISLSAWLKQLAQIAIYNDFYKHCNILIAFRSDSVDKKTLLGRFCSNKMIWNRNCGTIKKTGYFNSAFTLIQRIIVLLQHCFEISSHISFCM